jgi:hypothetical protein
MEADLIYQDLDVDGLGSVDLDQWADSKRSYLTAPELFLAAQMIEVPVISDAVPVSLAHDIYVDTAADLDEWARQFPHEGQRRWEPCAVYDGCSTSPRSSQRGRHCGASEPL